MMHYHSVSRSLFTSDDFPALGRPTMASFNTGSEILRRNKGSAYAFDYNIKKIRYTQAVKRGNRVDAVYARAR